VVLVCRAAGARNEVEGEAEQGQVPADAGGAGTELGPELRAGFTSLGVFDRQSGLSAVLGESDRDEAGAAAELSGDRVGGERFAFSTVPEALPSMA